MATTSSPSNETLRNRLLNDVVTPFADNMASLAARIVRSTIIGSAELALDGFFVLTHGELPEEHAATVRAVNGGVVVTGKPASA